MEGFVSCFHDGGRWMRMLAGGYGGRAESTSTFERNLPSCTRHAKGWITDDVTANYIPATILATECRLKTTKFFSASKPR